MRALVKINYAIAIFVIFLGFLASYVTSQQGVPAVSVKPEQEIVSESAKAVPSPQDAKGWQYDCKLSLEGMENCTAQMTFGDAAQQALLVSLSARQAGGETASPRMKLLVPLGSFLPAGISMRIDENDPFIVPFQACAVEGCFVNLDLAPDVVEALQAEGRMVVEYMTPTQEITAVEVPLRGVRDVFKRVMP